MARGRAGGLERPPLWATIVIVVGSVLLVVLGIYAATRDPAEPLSQAELDRMQAAASEAAASDAAAQPLVVAFLGDSYTQGTGADRPQSGFAQLTATALDCQIVTNGQGSTGYTTDAGDPAKAAYADRVADIVAAKPDLVVVEGSVNDRRAAEADIEAAAGEVFDGLREGLPDATIVALGALFTPGTDDAQIQVTKDAVGAAAAAREITFVDPDGWLDVADDSLWFDDIHPTQAGHQIIADRLSDAVRPELEALRKASN